jgi:flagellar FliL protein
MSAPPPASAPSPSAGGAENAPPKKKGKTLLFVGVGVLALAGGVGVVVLRGGKDDAAHAPKIPVIPVEPTAVELEPFILNLADPTGDRYFRLNLRLVLDQRALAERAAGRHAQAKLRDRVLTVLSKKRAASLTAADARDALRSELMDALEPLLAEPPLYDAAHDPAPARLLDALFTEYLVQ